LRSQPPPSALSSPFACPSFRLLVRICHEAIRLNVLPCVVFDFVRALRRRIRAVHEEKMHKGRKKESKQQKQVKSEKTLGSFIPPNFGI
jgi:hypothetical protein